MVYIPYYARPVRQNPNVSSFAPLPLLPPFPPDPPKIGTHELILGIVAQNAPPSSLDYHMVYVKNATSIPAWKTDLSGVGFAGLTILRV